MAAIALSVAVAAAGASYLTTQSQLDVGIDQTLRNSASLVNVADGGGHNGGDHQPQGGHVGDGQCPDPGSFQPAAAAQLVSTSGAVTACIVGGPRLPTTPNE